MNEYFTRPYQGDVIKVTGMEGAGRFPMMANSTAAMFDLNEDIFYLKTTDSMGTPTIRKFSFTEIVDPKPENIYVTKDELKEMIGELKGLITNAQHPVSSER